MGDLAIYASPASESVLSAAWFKSIGDPMLLCDRSWVVLAANQAAANLLDLPANDLLHRKADEVLAPAVPAAPSPQQPPPARVEWRCEFFTPQGVHRKLEISGMALRDGSTGA